MTVLKFLLSVLLVAFLLISALVAVQFFFDNTPLPTEVTRNDVVERLAKTKAALEAGLSWSDLADQEAEIRATAELADRLLSAQEREAIGEAVLAIRQTRAAWKMMVDGTCRKVGKMIHLEGCGDQLNAVVKTLGLDLYLVCRDSQCFPESVAGLLLSVCKSRLESAIGQIVRETGS